MSENELKFDLSDPPAYSHANVYNVDLEKGLPLYKPKDIKKLSYTTSFKTKERKKKIMTEFDSFNGFFTDFRKNIDHYFPENVVVKSKWRFFSLIFVLSLLCTLAISYRFNFLPWLLTVSIEKGYGQALPSGIFLVIWAIFFALFCALIWPFILTVRIAAKVIIFIVVGLGNGLAWFVGAIFWGFYNILVFFLGMEFER
ncbi:hypothetical protein SPOG_02114 [Schizosaccharomyces cryophilus OY26]|uniref:Uncharacterized protein n=1 Tax=Schizosaccharomyces cryophilus (strain OY26 / ATCC MYA-4695 / CBS 11777 / NBRC 106824 / NRRL Y48691) TaxID=653667 RepID=S9W455_SCHCR|nr:uncharacterized protein SPOG_02114 [Schizosaccharomyces cryophilus OY26]EPY52795.1 hypothetical protein SPOG_02114 [Schizosaccharomyces cryophilus OY26]